MRALLEVPAGATDEEVASIAFYRYEQHKKSNLLSLIDLTKLTKLSLKMRLNMQTINMHDAKTQLSRLVELAVQGEDFIIAKAGKPLVKVTRIDAPAPKLKRKTGFMLGQMSVPDDFDAMGLAEIDALFNQTV